MEIINKIKSLQNTEIRDIINQRLAEFSSFSRKDDDYWFSELCFCILTANSKAKTALKIQDKMGKTGFYKHPPEIVKGIIIDCKHRFHNNKTDYIVCAREHFRIKDIIENMDDFQAREWIVENIKGIGYKEASHFLRNTGRKSLAILDRHILKLMHEEGIISMPKTLTRNIYLDIEKSLRKIADELIIPMAELDLYMWCMKTGEVLK